MALTTPSARLRYLAEHMSDPRLSAVLAEIAAEVAPRPAGRPPATHQTAAQRRNELLRLVHNRAFASLPLQAAAGMMVKQFRRFKANQPVDAKNVDAWREILSMGFDDLPAINTVVKILCTDDPKLPKTRPVLE